MDGVDLGIDFAAAVEDFGTALAAPALTGEGFIPGLLAGGGLFVRPALLDGPPCADGGLFPAAGLVAGLAPTAPFGFAGFDKAF